MESNHPERTPAARPENVHSSTPLVPLIQIETNPLLYTGSSYTPYSPMKIDELAVLDEHEDTEYFMIPACAPKELGRAERFERVMIEGTEHVIPRFQVVLVDNATWYTKRYNTHPGMAQKIYG